VKNVIISEQKEKSENYNKFVQIIQDKNINVIVVKDGDRVVVDKYTYIDILWPIIEQIEENMLNNNSIVMRLNYADFKILFTGDIEKEAEEEIVKLYKEAVFLKADVLKVAHHGSKTSSIDEFIKLVNPQVALIGVGADNTFGHPNDDVLNRIYELRCKSL